MAFALFLILCINVVSGILQLSPQQQTTYDSAANHHNIPELQHAQRDIALMESILADESTLELPPGPTAGLASLDLIIGEDRSSSRWKNNEHHKVASYQHGRTFSQTAMPFPFPTRMGGVASYTAGRLLAFPNGSSIFRTSSTCKEGTTDTHLIAEKSIQRNNLSDSRDVSSIHNSIANKSPLDAQVPSDLISQPMQDNTQIVLHRGHRQTKKLLLRLRKLSTDRKRAAVSSTQSVILHIETGKSNESKKATTLRMATEPKEYSTLLLRNEFEVRSMSSSSGKTIFRSLQTSSPRVQNERKSAGHAQQSMSSVFVCCFLSMLFGGVTFQRMYGSPSSVAKTRDRFEQLLPTRSSVPVASGISVIPSNFTSLLPRSEFACFRDRDVVRTCSNRSRIPL
eukprot:m.116149 g.116149  ORF g.116149 m.116149 type:complete len:397 (+) comp17167_c0_seq1:210-1400(+)